MVRASGWKPEGRWFNSNFRQVYCLFFWTIAYTYPYWGNNSFTIIQVISFIIFHFSYTKLFFLFVMFSFFGYNLYSDLKLFWERRHYYDFNYNFDYKHINILYYFFKKKLKKFFTKFISFIIYNEFWNIFFRSNFKWSPIFKKTSYFGLYSSWRNKF